MTKQVFLGNIGFLGNLAINPQSPTFPKTPNIHFLKNYIKIISRP